MLCDLCDKRIVIGKEQYDNAIFMICETCQKHLKENTVRSLYGGQLYQLTKELQYVSEIREKEKEKEKVLVKV